MQRWHWCSCTCSERLSRVSLQSRDLSLSLAEVERYVTGVDLPVELPRMGQVLDRVLDLLGHGSVGHQCDCRELLEARRRNQSGIRTPPGGVGPWNRKCRPGGAMRYPGASLGGDAAQPGSLDREPEPSVEREHERISPLLGAARAAAIERTIAEIEGQPRDLVQQVAGAEIESALKDLAAFVRSFPSCSTAYTTKNYWRLQLATVPWQEAAHEDPPRVIDSQAPPR